MTTLRIQVDRDVSLPPRAQRILLKAIRTRDDLDQLYAVIRSSIADGNDIAVEVWENINQEEVDKKRVVVGGETSFNN
jgi:hypothetical protein